MGTSDIEASATDRLAHRWSMTCCLRKNTSGDSLCVTPAGTVSGGFRTSR